MSELLKFYSDAGPERVGVLMRDGSLVEVENTSSNPDNSCAIDPAFLVQHEDTLMATFHTHPGASSNLSGEDYKAFSNWPELLHYIVGNDGVRCYEVTAHGIVVRNN